jgi:dienelactone hydrolase
MRFQASTLLICCMMSACSYLPAPDALPTGTTLIEDRNSIILSTVRSATSTTGFLFYPGALVDPHAYVGLMQQLSSIASGYRVFIAKVPANLAVLQPGAAESIIQNHPEIKNWVIGGHSLGGTMACSWVSRRPESVRGLMLLASYPAKSDDLSAWRGSVLTIYGTNDGVLNKDNLASAYIRLPKKLVVSQISGGNHAYFGNYGEQKGDGQATISRATQQYQTTQQFASFMRSLGL